MSGFINKTLKHFSAIKGLVTNTLGFLLGGFSLVCFLGGQAVFPSLRTAPACALRWLDPALGRPGFLGEVQGSGEAGKAGGLALPWGDSLADERRPGAWGAPSLRSSLLGISAWVPNPEVSLSTVRACSGILRAQVPGSG